MSLRSRSGWRRHLRDLPAILAALGVACVVEIGLHLTTLPRLARMLGVPLAEATTDGPSPAPPSAERPSPAAVPAAAKRQIRATRIVLRHWPFGDTCLRQALVSGQRLRRLDPALHVGVAKLDGEVRAHAWIVVDGVVIDPIRAASDYLTLAAPQTADRESAG